MKNKTNTSQKKKIMKNLKNILAIFMILILPFSFIACSNKTDNNDKSTKIFVGIAIYQKLNGSLNWSKFNEKPSTVNNIISTKNNKIILDEDPELLFFIYSQNEITGSTKDENFITNTQKETVSIKDNSINFTIARIIEDTEILVYYIYKLENNSYYLEYYGKKDNVSKDSESFTFEISHDLFSNINLKLEKNLSIKKEY